MEIGCHEKSEVRKLTGVDGKLLNKSKEKPLVWRWYVWYDIMRGRQDFLNNDVNEGDWIKHWEKDINHVLRGWAQETYGNDSGWEINGPGNWQSVPNGWF